MPSLKSLAAASALALSTILPVHAQLVDADPDWKEVDAPKPPVPDVRRLLPIDMQRRSVSLAFGIDPASLNVGTDGVVRYVAVAHGEGVVNAMYEGLRCGTAEVRTYARYNDGRWSPVQDGEWKSVHDSQSRHALMFARQGGCVGRGVPRTPSDIVRSLKYPDLELQR